jgi:hypothetical protein
MAMGLFSRRTFPNVVKQLLNHAESVLRIGMWGTKKREKRISNQKRSCFKFD